MKNKLNYFITRSSMFGIGFFLMFKHASKDAWIAVILGTLIGIGILYFYKFIKDFFRNQNIYNTLKKTFIGKIYLIILYLFYLFLITLILVLLPMFVNSFYLLYTPKILIVLPFLLLAYYITTKEKYVLESLSSFLCVISISIIIIYAFFLTKYLDFNNLTPILSTKVSEVIKAAFIYASLTSVPQIITIHYHGNSFKDDLKGYLLASFLTFTITIFTTLALGEYLIKVYSFPEYAVLKQIKLLDFIENIENLSSFIWYFDLFITLATLTTNIKEILPKKGNIFSNIITLLIILYISVFIIGKNYRLIITFFYMTPYILYIFFFLFITLLIYLKIKKSSLEP